MKKFIFSLLLIAFSTTVLQAQDFIYLRDGNRIKAKITSAEGKQVLYRNYDDPESPLYALKKSQILMIAYEKGNVDFYKKEADIVQRYIFKKNLLTYHLADLIINNFTLSYEHLFKNGSMGLQIPLAFGYNYYEESDGFKSDFYSGIYLNFYPTGQGKWRYFLGPGLRIGTGQYKTRYYDYEIASYVEKNQKGLMYGKLFVNNGIMFTPITSLSLSAVAHLGIRYVPDLMLDSNVHTAVAFSFNMSYRF